MADIEEKMKHLNKVDKYILLLLGENNYESIRGPLWLQKEMFVLQELYSELRDETDYEPYFMGPHSEIIENEAEELKNSRLVETVHNRIQLTEDGKKLYNYLKSDYKDKLAQISEFKKMLNNLTKDELLAFIYFSYPSPEELEKESTEYEQLLPKREKLAISLYLKDKISAQRVAQIAGKDFSSFVEKLKDVV